jgi:hypothetical protein
MKEGVGAGYTITFYDVKIKNVKITRREKGKYEDESIDYFTADIVPNRYDFTCDHPYWYIDSRRGDDNYIDLQNGHTIFLPTTKAEIIRGTVTGWFNVYDDEHEEDFTEDIESKTYAISDVYGGGYLHSDITKTIELESKYGIAEEYLNSAEITLSDNTVFMMNDCIDMSIDPYAYDYVDEDEEYEEDNDNEEEDDMNYEPSVEKSEENYDEGFEESLKFPKRRR